MASGDGAERAEDLWSPRHVILLRALVAAGFLLRVVRLAWNAPLHVDALALDVTRRSFADLFAPLEHVQAAPPLHLLLAKCAVALFGDGELALRIVPFVAGCSALVLFGAWARRTLSPAGGLVAAALLATAWRLVDATAFEKHYASDVFAAAALLWLADRSARRDRTVPLAAACAIAPWLSFPSSFLVAAILATRWIGAPPARRVRDVLAVGAPWAVSAAVLYGLVVPAMTDVAATRAWWARDFVPWGEPAALPRWFALHGPHPALSLVAPPEGTWVAAAIVAWLTAHAVLAVRRRERADLARWALLGGPAALACVAAAAQAYPVAHRLFLFAAPGLAALLAATTCEAARAGRLRRVAGVALLVAVLVPNAAKAVWTAASPPPRPDVRALADAWAPRVRPGDVVVAAPTARQCVLYYAARHAELSRLRVILPSARPEDADALIRTVRAAAPTSRVWMVFADGGREDETTRATVRERAAARGAVVESVQATRAEALCIGAGRLPDPDAPPPDGARPDSR